MATVKIRPGVGLLSLFPAMNYKPWIALGEMVDNSIQSYLEHKEELRAIHGDSYRLMIDIQFEGGRDPRILVEDNAAGIYEKDVDRAFTPAARPPDRTGISQYGIGMKSAATWYSNHYVITSQALGESVTRIVTFDIERIIEEEIEELDVIEEPKKSNQHGTRIVMRDLHQGIPTGQTLGKIRSYIASIYREFIRSEDIGITVAGELLSYHQPALLHSAYWDTDKGPAADSLDRRWLIQIDITLDESWEADVSPNRANRPPRIRGWMGILKEGSTRQSGLALIWRNKVVVGAGSMAQGDEDSYRPQSIFGATTTFPFQRMIGELDVSSLQVTTFKDQIDWRAGQEVEMQQKIRAAIDAGDEPLLRMAKNYRSTVKTKPIQDEVRKSLDEASEAARRIVAEVANETPEDLIRFDPSEPPLSSDDSDGLMTQIPFSTNPPLNLIFEICTRSGDNQWLRLDSRTNGDWHLTLNRSHPFMNSFANLPGADLDPIIRIAMGIGLAEISARNSGLEFSSFIRKKLNEMLTGDLSSRQDLVEN
jgi:hypothetical protein